MIFRKKKKQYNYFTPAGLKKRQIPSSIKHEWNFTFPAVIDVNHSTENQKLQLSERKLAWLDPHLITKVSSGDTANGISSNRLPTPFALSSVGAVGHVADLLLSERHASDQLGTWGDRCSLTARTKVRKCLFGHHRPSTFRFALQQLNKCGCVGSFPLWKAVTCCLFPRKNNVIIFFMNIAGQTY